MKINITSCFVTLYQPNEDGKEEKEGGEKGAKRGQSPEVTRQLSHSIRKTANTHTHTLRVHWKYLSWK